MNDSQTATAPSPVTLDLPELQDALLDATTVAQLFRDIEACTEVTEVISKSAARAHVEASTMSLADAREQLLARQLRGLQIRYRYDGADWWDTLLCVQGQFRLVRIRHDFAGLQRTDPPAGT